MIATQRPHRIFSISLLEKDKGNDSLYFYIQFKSHLESFLQLKTSHCKKRRMMIKQSRGDVKIVKGFKIMSLEIQLKELDLLPQRRPNSREYDKLSTIRSDVIWDQDSEDRIRVGTRVGNNRKTDFDLIQRKTSWKWDLSKNEMGHLNKFSTFYDFHSFHLQDVKKNKKVDNQLTEVFKKKVNHKLSKVLISHTNFLKYEWIRVYFAKQKVF